MKQLLQTETWLISESGMAALEHRIESEASQSIEVAIATGGEEAVKIPDNWKNIYLQPSLAKVSSKDWWDIAYEDNQRRRKEGVEAEFLETSIGKQIAILHIKGALVYDCSIFQEYWYDVCSMKRIARIFDELRQNSNVIGVILCVNSPGGAVSGTSLAVKHLRMLREAKPVLSLVEQATSGAQILVAETERIICVTEAVTMGSLGVYTMLYDRSEFQKQIGIKKVYVTATRSVRKLDYRDDKPLSKAAKEAITERMDEILDWMIGIMMNGRGIDEESIVFTANIYRSEKAIELGLADEIAEGDALEAAIRALLSNLANYIPPSRRSDNGNASAATKDNNNTIISKNDTEMSGQEITFANLPAAKEGGTGKIVAFNTELGARNAGEFQEANTHVLVPKSYMEQLDETFANSDVEESAKLKEQVENVLGQNDKILAAHKGVKGDLEVVTKQKEAAEASVVKHEARIKTLEGIIKAKLGEDALKGGGDTSNADSSLENNDTPKGSGGSGYETLNSRISQMEADMKKAGI